MDKARRALLQHGMEWIGASTVIPAVDMQNITTGFRGVFYPSGPEDKELKYLEQKIRDYWYARQNVTLAPADLILHVEAYVREVTTILNRSLLPSIRARLCTCLSQGMLLIGVSLYSMGQFQTARMYYRTAIEAAHEAKHNILQALAWYWDSYSWMRSSKHNRDKLALGSMLKACQFASLESDRAVQGVTLAGSAEAHAYLKEKAACVEALDNAAKVTGSGQSDWSHIHRFDLSHLNGYRGIGLQQFYEPGVPDTYPLLEEARQALEETLSQPNIVAMTRAFCMVDLAQVYARKGEVESACAYAQRVMSIAGTNASIQQHLWVVYTYLEPYSDVEVVKVLDKEIKSLQLSV